jgi:hypothetical protein
MPCFVCQKLPVDRPSRQLWSTLDAFCPNCNEYAEGRLNCCVACDGFRCRDCRLETCVFCGYDPCETVCAIIDGKLHKTPDLDPYPRACVICKKDLYPGIRKDPDIILRTPNGPIPCRNVLYCDDCRLHSYRPCAKCDNPETCPTKNSKPIEIVKPVTDRVSLTVRRIAHDAVNQAHLEYRASHRGRKVLMDVGYFPALHRPQSRVMWRSSSGEYLAFDSQNPDACLLRSMFQFHIYGLCPHCKDAIPWQDYDDIHRHWVRDIDYYHQTECPRWNQGNHNTERCSRINSPNGKRPCQTIIDKIKEVQKRVCEELRERRLNQELAEYKFCVVDCMIGELEMYHRDRNGV